MKRVLLVMLCLPWMACGGGNPTKTVNHPGEVIDTVITPQKKFNPAEGLSEGVNVSRYPNGQIKMKGEVLQGKRHGVWTTWRDNGMKWSENTYSLGVLDGKTVSYYENGQVHYIGYYKNNQKDGQWLFYDEDGELLKEEKF